MGTLSVIFFYTNDQLPKITKVKFREFCVFLRLKNPDCVPALQFTHQSHPTKPRQRGRGDRGRFG